MQFMFTMTKKKVKFGKRITIYLSYEVINRLNKLSSNKSAFIEALINKSYDKK